MTTPTHVTDKELLARAAPPLDAHGICNATMTQLTSGAFLTGYLLALGSSEVVIGVAGALPLAARLVQLYASWRIERGSNWYRLNTIGAVLGRLPLFLAALLPLLGAAVDLSRWLLIGVIVLCAVGGALWEIAFLTWMGELVPLRLRGAFWGKRTRVAEIAGLVAALAASFLLDAWQADHPGSIDGFALVFGVAAVAGAISLFTLRAIPLAPRFEPNRGARLSLRAALQRPTRDINFRRFLRFTLVWGITVGLMGPFTPVYMLSELHLSVGVTTLLTVLPTMVIALTQSYWGELVDHFGSKPVLRAATYMIAVSTLMWLTSGPDLIWPLFVAQVLSGVGWSAYNISTSTLVLKLAPGMARSSYIASQSAVFALAQSIAPVVGGVLLQWMGEWMDSVHSYYVLFALSGLIRLVASQMLGTLEEPGGTHVSHMIRVLGRLRGMGAHPAASVLYDYASTRFARMADFVTREGKSGMRERRRIRRALRRAARRILRRGAVQ